MLKEKDRKPRGPLDELLAAYLKGLETRLEKPLVDKAKSEKRFFTREPKATLHLNATGLSFRFDKDGAKGLTEEDLNTEELDALVTALRKRMPETAWPISITIKFDGLVSWREDPYYNCRPKCSGLGFANIKKDDLRLNAQNELYYEMRDGWTDCGMGGLDNIAEAMTLVASILRPTNRPVMAWSPANDIMNGTAHVNSDRIYARTEVEAMLKETVSRYGTGPIKEAIKTGKFERPNNHEKGWWVATDMGELDKDPIGQVQRENNLYDDLDEMLQLAAPEAGIKP